MGQVTKTLHGLVKETDFTNAQVIAWPTTSLTLVPGIPGKVLVPERIILCLDPWFANYTNVDAGALILPFVAGVQLVFGFAITTAFINSVLANGQPGFLADPLIQQNGTVAGQLSGAIVAVFSNAAAGNLTGGNAGNVLKVFTHYSEFIPV